MANRIPGEIIDKVQQSADIVEVIGEYVQLKKQGRNYFGLCPFHGESTPSFSVSPEKQIFHCFGCGAGGNVFSFLMQMEGTEFGEAVQKLADRQHIEMPESVPAMSSDRGQSADEKKMLEAHELLKKFYHHLLVNTKEGEEALDYLTGRGFTKEVIEKFEIGYSLPSWDYVTRFLTKRGYDPSLMERAGLLVKKQESGDFLDRFRNRIMFPIHDHHGSTVAFSGRVLSKEQPKYLNSPETKLFNKSRLLYNFYQARIHIRKHQEAVLLEGFADVISSVSAGVENAVATMGTSLTEEQAKILKRNSSAVTICYDADSAGIEAAMRAGSTLSGMGGTVKVALMPDGFDPDDYIKKFGAAKFKDDVIGASVSYMAFKLRYFKRGKNLQNETERLQYIEQSVKEISQLQNAVEQEIYLKQLSSECSISIEVLKERLQELRRSAPRGAKNQQAAKPKAAAVQTRTPNKRRLRPAFHNAERMLIAHMLRNSEHAERVLDLVGLQFNIEEHRAIVTYLYAFYEEGNEENISSFLQKLPDPKLYDIVSDIAMMQINDEFSEQELQDYVRQVLNHQKMLIIKEKELEKNEAERQKDYLQAAKIGMEIVQLKRSFK
ncbi:DNA primase [Metabacillus sp. GX 13764]|uniref:DNA primase n=1 Tax=Metabacillus kandeliae TaxID=2900151 RepID=UPI001E47813A|nr:DNA primase [Metabacillus kandeliae]MCD7033068.1 DNA primase [Metabacillus kandeliae]